MPTILTEKNLKGSVLSFEFSDKWQVCKYDEQSFYNAIKYQGVKGVDFVASSDKGLLLMEIKYILAADEKSSLRFSPDDDKDKLDTIKTLLTPTQQKTVTIKSIRPYLVDEVSNKIRDTLLGLFASYRQQESALSPYARPLFFNHDKAILVLLFLERNEELNRPENFKPLADNLKLAIEQKLKFLGNIHVGVVNSLTLPSQLGIKILDTQTRHEV
jgi:hypothetical protein